MTGIPDEIPEGVYITLGTHPDAHGYLELQAMADPDGGVWVRTVRIAKDGGRMNNLLQSHIPPKNLQS